MTIFGTLLPKGAVLVGGLPVASIIQDLDGDTSVNTEVTPDADIVQIKAGGSKIVDVSSTQVSITNVLTTLTGAGTALQVNSGGPGDFSGAVFRVFSTTQAILLPVLTTAERDLVSPTKEGMLLYNETTVQYEYFDGTSWRRIGEATYTERFTSFTAGASGSWQTVALGGIPANTVVEIIGHIQSNNTTVGVREVGSALTRSLMQNNGTSIALTVKTDATSQVEVFTSDDANTTFYVTAEVM